MEDNTPDEKSTAYQYQLMGKLQGDELNIFSTIVTDAYQWPVMRHILKTIIQNPVEDVSVINTVTPAQLTTAYKGYWCAQKLAAIAIKTMTEWKKNPTRWNALDKIMGHTESTPNHLWTHEKSKIDKLCFWDEVSGIIGNTDGRVWGLNPIDMVINFTSKKRFNPDKFVELYVPKHPEEFGGIEKTSVDGGKKVDVKIKVRAINQVSKDNLRRLANDIALYFEENPDECWIPYMAYMLATARLESYDYKKGIYFAPIAEFISESQANYFYGSGADSYNRNRAKKLGNTEVGDGYKYRGRGFVQLTWKINYKNRDAEFFNGGLDLINYPERAMEWNNAIKIMIKGMLSGSFTGSKLSTSINITNKNYMAARDVINGVRDRANFLASYAVIFESLIEDSMQ